MVGAIYVGSIIHEGNGVVHSCESWSQTKERILGSKLRGELFALGLQKIVFLQLAPHACRPGCVKIQIFLRIGIFFSPRCRWSIHPRSVSLWPNVGECSNDKGRRQTRYITAWGVQTLSIVQGLTWMITYKIPSNIWKEMYSCCRRGHLDISVARNFSVRNSTVEYVSTVYWRYFRSFLSRGDPTIYDTGQSVSIHNLFHDDHEQQWT